MPMVRPCLPCEQDNQHKKDAKKKLGSFQVQVDVLVASVTQRSVEQQAPKAVAKPKPTTTTTKDKKVTFKHIELPELSLSKK